MKPCLTSIVVFGALFLGEATMCGQEGETAPDNGSPVWAAAGMVRVVAVAIPLSTLGNTQTKTQIHDPSDALSRRCSRRAGCVVTWVSMWLACLGLAGGPVRSRQCAVKMCCVLL